MLQFSLHCCPYFPFGHSVHIKSQNIKTETDQYIVKIFSRESYALCENINISEQSKRHGGMQTQEAQMVD